MKQKLASLVFMLVLLLGTISCAREEVLSNLENKQTLPLMLAFEKAGVRAYKEKYLQGRQEKYRLLVNSGDYARALAVLKNVTIPKNDWDQWSLLLKQSHFSSDSPEMAGVKRDLATSLQLEKLLLGLSGVLDARVYVRQGGAAATTLFSAESAAKSVIVVLRFSNKVVEQAPIYQAVKQVVQKAIPDLAENDLTVLFNDQEMNVEVNIPDDSEMVILDPFRFRVAQADAWLAKKQIISFGLLAVLAGFILGALLHISYQGMTGRSRSERLALNSGADENSVSSPNRSLVSRKPTVVISTKE